MAAVTGTVIALGGLGLSAAQAIKANKDMKQASQAAQKAAGELKKIKEFNAFKQVQVPTLGFELAQQSQAQAQTQAMQALQGAGAEGVIGGVGNVLQASNLAAGEQAAKLGELKLQRDINEAESQQGIEARKQEREFMIGQNELQSAQMQRVAAEERRNAAIEGMFSSAGTALTSGAGAVDLYKQNQYANNAGWTTNTVTNPYVSTEMSPISSRP